MRKILLKAAAAALLCLWSSPVLADQWFSEERHATWISGVVMSDEYVAQSVRIFTEAEDGSVLMIDFRDDAAHVLMLEKQGTGRAELPVGRFEGTAAVEGGTPADLSFIRESSGRDLVTRFTGLPYKDFIEMLLPGGELSFSIKSEGRPCRRRFSLDGFRSAYEKAFVLNRKIGKSPAYGKARAAAPVEPEQQEEQPAAPAPAPRKNKKTKPIL